MFRSLVASVAFSFVATLALAQDATMKSCGEKWQAAKASGAAAGTTWPKFLAECRAGTSPAPITTPEIKPSVAPVKSKPAPAGEPVLPSAVDAQFAGLRPAQARQKTCSAQYKANKANGGNAGLPWIQKGGGYWSLCNKKLKEA